jgi:hypothetical protein
MKYLVARKWFVASILASGATFGTKFAAEIQAWKAASTLARAAQDVTDGKTAEISQGTRRQAMTHARRADAIRPLGFATWVAGLIALAVSVWKREPARQVVSVVLLATAGLIQFLIF